MSATGHTVTSMQSLLDFSTPAASALAVPTVGAPSASTSTNSADSAPPMPAERAQSAVPASLAQSLPAEPASPTTPGAAESPKKPEPEVGPNTIVAACRIVASHYNGSVTSVYYELEPVVRDGSIIEFYLPNSRTRLAQGRIWIAPHVTFDKDHNGYLAVAVRDITYQPEGNTIRFNAK